MYLKLKTRLHIRFNFLTIFILICVNSCVEGGPIFDPILIYSGSSYYDVAYTIRGDKIYSGSSYYDLAYTIRGDKIYNGSSYYDLAYTIRADKIYSGYKIYVGSSYYDVAYTIRQ